MEEKAGSRAGPREKPECDALSVSPLGSFEAGMVLHTKLGQKVSSSQPPISLLSDAGYLRSEYRLEKLGNSYRTVF